MENTVLGEQSWSFVVFSRLSTFHDTHVEYTTTEAVVYSLSRCITVCIHVGSQQGMSGYCVVCGQ